MSESSGGWSGPSWADFWLSAAEVEREMRCRVVVRLSGSKVFKTGSVVELFLSRRHRPNHWHGIAHVDALFPSKRFKTMPALLLSLLHEARDAGYHYDEREHRQLDIMDLPLPPSPDE